MKLLQEFGFPYQQCVKALNAVRNESLVWACGRFAVWLAPLA